MKRTLSLVLALVMVLGTFSVTFAAEKTVEEKAGEILKTLEVMTGDDAGLRLEDGLKREEAVVMIARLKGQLEVAQNFPTKPTYKDITNKAYEPLLAWAKEDGTFVGHSETKFGFGDNITTQEYASVVLRILGYEVGVEKEITWNDVMAKAEELGLLKNIDAKADFLRGNMAVMTLNALRTNVKDSKETLAEKLELDVPAEEPELSTDIEITAAKAVANNKVEITVKEEVAASKADFTMFKKGTTTEIEIKDIVKESAKVFVLETEALTAGTAYTVKSNGKALNFTGIAVDKTAPTAKVTATDTNRFEVEFSDLMDKATAENVENYTFDKDLKVVNATLSSSRKVVELETDAAKANTTYKLTIENVTNSDGVVMKKASFNVRAKEYKTLPVVDGGLVLHSNNGIEIKFKASVYGMDKESLETLANYTIEGLEIVEAKAYKNADGIYDKVLLVTEEQEVNKAYKLNIAGLKDASVLGNVIKTKDFSFRGKRADSVAPVVKELKAKNGNELKVSFKDESGLDIGSIEDISNYKITYKDKGKDVELNVLEAKAGSKVADLLGRYNDTNQFVTLITEEQEANKRYTIEISNIEDLAGNVMKSAYKGGFTGEGEDNDPPAVVSVKHLKDNEVQVIFSDKSDLNKGLAQDPTNYQIKNVGSAIKATLASDGKTLKLITPSLTDGTTYELTIENIEDEYGNLMPKKVAKFVTASTSLDTVAPDLLDVYAENKDEVHFIFDEAIATGSLGNITFENAEGNRTFVYSGSMDDGTRVVYKSNGISLADKEYTVPTAAVFKDGAGNQVTIPSGTAALKFRGTTTDNVRPEVVDYYQTDVRTITLVFDEPVQLKAGDINKVTAAGVSIDRVSKAFTSNDTHITEWNIRFVRPLKDKDVIKLTMTTNIDLGGAGLEKVLEIKDLYFTDEEDPYIEDIVVVDNETVKVIFNEELSYAGTYKIIKEGTTTNIVSSVSYDENEVTIKTSKLNAANLYTLEVVTPAKDLAGNTSEKGVWGDFLGSNVAPANKYIAGVSFINGNKIKVTSNNLDLRGITVSGDVYVTDAVYTSNNTVATITTKIPFLADVEYTVTATNGSDHNFKGIIENLGIKFEAVKDSSDVVLGYSVIHDGYAEEYTVEVLKLNGDEFTETVTVGVGEDAKTYYATTVVDADRYVVLKDASGLVLYAAKVPAVIPAP